MKTYYFDNEKNKKYIFEITEHVFADDMKKVVATYERIKSLVYHFLLMILVQDIHL